MWRTAKPTGEGTEATCQVPEGRAVVTGGVVVMSVTLPPPTPRRIVGGPPPPPPSCGAPLPRGGRLEAQAGGDPGATADPELAVHAAQVDLHRLGRHEQRLGDVAVAHALRS